MSKSTGTGKVLANYSVADPDPGSGPFSTPRIRDPE
jgi:hypothetical protein